MTFQVYKPHLSRAAERFDEVGTDLRTEPAKFWQTYGGKLGFSGIFPLLFGQSISDLGDQTDLTFKAGGKIDWDMSANFRETLSLYNGQEAENEAATNRIWADLGTSPTKGPENRDLGGQGQFTTALPSRFLTAPEPGEHNFASLIVRIFNGSGTVMSLSAYSVIAWVFAKFGIDLGDVFAKIVSLWSGDWEKFDQLSGVFGRFEQTMRAASEQVGDDMSAVVRASDPALRWEGIGADAAYNQAREAADRMATAADALAQGRNSFANIADVMYYAASASAEAIEIILDLVTELAPFPVPTSFSLPTTPEGWLALIWDVVLAILDKAFKLFSIIVFAIDIISAGIAQWIIMFQLLYTYTNELEAS